MANNRARPLPARPDKKDQPAGEAARPIVQPGKQMPVPPNVVSPQIKAPQARAARPAQGKKLPLTPDDKKRIKFQKSCDEFKEKERIFHEHMQMLIQAFEEPGVQRLTMDAKDKELLAKLLVSYRALTAKSPFADLSQDLSNLNAAVASWDQNTLPALMMCAGVHSQLSALISKYSKKNNNLEEAINNVLKVRQNRERDQRIRQLGEEIKRIDGEIRQNKKDKNDENAQKLSSRKKDLLEDCAVLQNKRAISITELLLEPAQRAAQYQLIFTGIAESAPEKDKKNITDAVQVFTTGGDKVSMYKDLYSILDKIQAQVNKFDTNPAEYHKFFTLLNRTDQMKDIRRVGEMFRGKNMGNIFGHDGPIAPILIELKSLRDALEASRQVSPPVTVKKAGFVDKLRMFFGSSSPSSSADNPVDTITQGIWYGFYKDRLARMANVLAGNKIDTYMGKKIKKICENLNKNKEFGKNYKELCILLGVIADSEMIRKHPKFTMHKELAEMLGAVAKIDAAMKGPAAAPLAART